MIAPKDKMETMARFREGAALLENAVKDLPEAVLDAPPARGGWTIRQIVHHLVDGDDIWKLCIKMAMGLDQPEFALSWYWGMPQQDWAERWAYSRRSLDVSLALFKANRAHILQLVESVPEAWERLALLRNPEGRVEEVPVGSVIQMQGDHVLHHIKRINEILQEQSDLVKSTRR